MSSKVVSRLLRRLGLDVRPAEVASASSLFLYFFCIGTVQFACKSVRQSSYVDSLGAEKLPFVYLLVALCAIPGLRLYGAFAGRIETHRLMVGTLSMVATSLVLFWWLFAHPWSWIAVVYYVWISLATVLMISQLWSFANQRFDPRQARRLFGFVGAGGLLGSVAGGQLANFASRSGTRTVLLAGAALLLVAVAILTLIDRSGRAHSLEKGPGRLTYARGAWAAIRRSPHLQGIALLMFLSVMVAQIVDLQFNWVIEGVSDNLDERTAIFGNVFSIMGLAAFLFQILATARIHRTLGVSFAMRVLPISVAVGSTLLLVNGPLISAAALLYVVSGLRISESGLRYSLDQATRELLFVPVPEEDRRVAKAFIDVLVQRLARGVAAVVLLTVTFGWLEPLQASWIALVLVVVWLGVTVVVRRHYVASLRRGLEASRMQRPHERERLESLDPNDVNTLEVLIESLGGTDPVRVLHGVDLLAAHGRGRLVPPLLLYHDDPSVRQRTLQVLVAEERRDALPLIERLIGDADLEVRAEATRALAALSGTARREIMRPRLHDPDLRVRSAAISCLASQGGSEDARRAEEALLELLTDADVTARTEAARAMSEIDEPRFQAHLVQLLYDADGSVVREAIVAVRRRVERQGNSPLYVPILISLLRHRRLKHEAREALVACGESVIPALVHFMNDPNESIWVRRALPKTIARLQTESARRALLASLSAEDLFLRSKVIEALGSLEGRMTLTDEIEDQLITECQHYFRCLVDLLSVSDRGDFRLVGPTLNWAGRRSPSLLQELISNRMSDHVRNLFGLLALLAPRQDIWGAYQRLVGERKDLRSNALEYLDNILIGASRRSVLAVIDDLVLSERVRLARRLFGLEVGSKVETLKRLISFRQEGDADAAWISAAAVHLVWRDRIDPLFEPVRRAAASSDPLVRETAEWVQAGLDSVQASS